MMSLNCSICLMPISGVGKVYRIWTPKGGPPQYSSRFRLVEDASYSGNGVTDAFGSVMVIQEHLGTFFRPAPCAFWRIRLNNWVDMLVFSFKGGRKCQIDCTKGNQHFPSKKTQLPHVLLHKSVRKFSCTVPQPFSKKDNSFASNQVKSRSLFRPGKLVLSTPGCWIKKIALQRFATSCKSFKFDCTSLVLLLFESRSSPAQLLRLSLNSLHQCIN
jgi:hypothetical protein